MSLHNKVVFSKIDLQRAYLQVPVAPEDIPKTAVCTPFGLFEYLYTPYGLRNAGATFQRIMDSLFSHLPNVHVYIDDIVISSENEQDHLKDIEEVLSILSKNDLRISPSKCEFMKTELTFLGYNIDANGIRPPPERVTAITNFPLPITSTDLRRFMGMLQFFRHMIPNFANIAFPISELLRCNPTSKSLPWTDSARTSFDNLKQALVDCPTLKFPSPKMSHYHLVTDSSNFAAGASLYQLIDGTPHPIAFFSKKYSEPQRSLSTYDRELLAAFFAILHFKTLIDGHSVTLFTDHKPLVSAFYSKNNPKSDRQQRQLSLISEYVSDMQYLCGRDNVVADCLSRSIASITTDIFDLPGLVRAQQSDPEFESYKDRLTLFTLPDNLILLCDTSLPTPRPYVPITLRSSVISFLHNLIVGPLKPPTLPSYTDSPYRYLLTCIDRAATRWTEAIPLVETSASSVAIAFLSGWISRFGVPLTCVTDRGSQFESELF